jgi:hypothetical protein
MCGKPIGKSADRHRNFGRFHRRYDARLDEIQYW